MAINFYGMPMAETSLGLSVIADYMEQGAAGAELILLDPVLCNAIYSAVEKEEAKYLELANAAKAEYEISTPQAATLASWVEFVGQCIVAGIEYATEAAIAIADFALNNACNVINGLTGAAASGLGELFKGPGGIVIIIAAIICLMIFL